MPVELRRLNAPTQQRQPEAGIELPVEKEALLAVRFCSGDHRFGKRSFVWPEGEVQCRAGGAQAGIVTHHHKFARQGAAGCQLIIKEPQYGLVMVWDIRSQDVNQCSHARLCQSKKTPQQAAK